MSPYEIHEAPIQHFSKHIEKALRTHVLNTDDKIACEVHHNMTIHKGPTVVIPNFMLDLRLLHRVALEPVPLWIGECGFSSIRSHMVYQLKSVVEIAPEMDAAFMICIREVKRKLPPTHNPLHSAPDLPCSAFSPSSTPANYLCPSLWKGSSGSRLNWSCSTCSSAGRMANSTSRTQANYTQSG
jgi:hypothetical protein